MRTTILFLFITAGLIFSQNAPAQSNNNCNLTAAFYHIDTANCETYFYPQTHGSSVDYFWDFGDGNTSNQPYSYHGYNSSGIYNVTLIVSDSVCSDTVTQMITINPCPAPCNISASFGYYDSACYTGFMPTPLDSTLNYQWSFGDGNYSTSISPEHLYNTPGSYNVTLSISNGTCSDTINQTVTAIACNNPCNVNASFIYRDTFNCHTAFDPSYYNFNHSYYWDFGDGNTSANQFPVY